MRNRISTTISRYLKFKCDIGFTLFSLEVHFKCYSNVMQISSYEIHDIQ